jgi:O-antigen ligase
LEYWKKSLGFFAEAPVFGHGTGSTRALFEQAAVGQTGAHAEIIGNPHNQTLNVAVQWGVTGIVVLYAMWLMHLLLFRGDGLVAWIGLLVVVQNIFTSLFNSHLFDFHEGWMYVLGVGVAGGIMLKTSSREAASGPGDPSNPGGRHASGRSSVFSRRLNPEMLCYRSAK